MLQTMYHYDIMTRHLFLFTLLVMGIILYDRRSNIFLPVTIENFVLLEIIQDIR